MSGQVSRTARSYKRLSDEELAEASHMWASGDHQLVDIAETFGVSIRSLQNHFQTAGVIKGEAHAEALAAIPVPLIDNELPADDDLPAVAQAAKARTYGAAIAIEDAIVRQVEIIKADPTQAHRAGTTLKALAAASAALEKVHALKVVALGLDQLQPDALPVLVVRELFADDVARMQAEDDDNEIDGHDDADAEVITLGDLPA